MLHIRHQSGFTLLEMLISMAISVIALSAAVLLMTKFARSVGAYSEVAIMEEARGSSEALLRTDFDNAGLNLTRPSMPSAGKENVQFYANPDFNTSTPGSLAKLTSNTSYAYSTRAVTSGNSLWSWTPAAVCKDCWTYVVGNDGNFGAIAVYYDENGVSAMLVYESLAPGGTVASSFGTGTALPPHVPGDTYQIGIEAPNAQQTNRFARYYRIRNGVRTILYTGTNPIPTYPHYLLAYQTSAPSAINNISVIGAPISYRTTNATDFARMPFDGGTQLTGPITVTGGPGWWFGTTAIVLSGDKTIDATPSLSTFTSSSTQLDLKTPQRGTYAIGDTIFAIDYGSNDPSNPVSPASAVCQVTAVATVDSQTTRLTLSRARQTNPAWGRLWSSDADHAHTFGPGTTIVKLAPPVTYTISTDSRLVRIEGDRASTVAFNARSLSFSPGTGSGGTQLIVVSATLAAEGFETTTGATTETRANINFSSFPRALNLASNQLN